MGAWGIGSGDTDGAHDWYPSQLVGESIVPPTAAQLNDALKAYLKKGGLPKECFEKEEFLGIAILGIRDGVIAAKSHLKLAAKCAAQLLDDEVYLGRWDEPRLRAKALKKEISAIEKVLGGKSAVKSKLTTGLLDALSAKTKSKKPKPLAKLRAAVKPKKSIAVRPSPSDSATKFKVGTRKKGGDGHMWIVARASNGVQRWKRA